MPDLTLPRGGIDEPHIYNIEDGDTGAHVYGVQRAINRSELVSGLLVLDGVYGDKTHNKVKRFQEAMGIDNDGKFGPQTSPVMSHFLQDKALAEVPKPLPENILRSIVKLESSDYMAANNWNVEGGVDLCYAQRRVLGPPFDDDAVMRAFDGLYQFKLVLNTLRGRHDVYFGQPGAKTHEKAWRLAVLYHNYQYAAEKIAEVGVKGLSSYWNTLQDWVVGFKNKFEDEQPVQTPLEHCKFYALGAPEHNHEGVAVRQVTNWNVT